jgi:hypothetical protein
MSKFASRLNKIEINLNPKEKRIIEVNIIGWDLPNSKNYFKDDNEKKWYQYWRITTINKEKEQKDIPNPLTVFNFDEEDVKSHIEAFHKYQKSSDGFKGWTPMEIMEFDRAFLDRNNS